MSREVLQIVIVFKLVRYFMLDCRANVRHYRTHFGVIDALIDFDVVFALQIQQNGRKRNTKANRTGSLLSTSRERNTERGKENEKLQTPKRKHNHLGTVEHAQRLDCTGKILSESTTVRLELVLSLIWALNHFSYSRSFCASAELISSTDALPDPSNE